MVGREGTLDVDAAQSASNTSRVFSARSSTIIRLPALFPCVRCTSQQGAFMQGFSQEIVRTSLPDFVKM